MATWYSSPEIEKSVGSFLQKINNAPPFSSELYTMIHSKHGVLPYVDKDIHMPQCLWQHPIPKWIYEMQKTEVFFKDLKTTQPHLSAERLTEMLTTRNMKKLRVGGIICIRHSDQLYVYDGNHRTNALMVLGDNSTSAYILDSGP